MNKIILVVLVMLTVTTFGQQGECEITKDIDKFTKVVSYGTPAIDFKDASIFFEEYSKSILVIVSLRKVDIFCISGSSVLTFLFTDGKVLKIHAVSTVNCSGNFVARIVAKKILLPLSNKKVEAIRIDGTGSFEQFDVEENVAQTIKTYYSCLINNHNAF